MFLKPHSLIASKNRSMKILSVLATLALATPAFAATKTIKGLEAEFHPQVLQILEDISARKPAEPLPEPKNLCETDFAITESLKSCPLTAEQIQELKNSRYFCRYANEPLLLYTQQPARPVEFADTKSVPTMLKVFGSAIPQSEIPGALARKDFYNQATIITQKVFAEEFRQGIKIRQAILSSIQKSCPDSLSIMEALRELRNAEDQLANLESRWPKLTELSYPTLTLQERADLTTFLSAMTWRARGGGIYQKIPGIFATQKNRVRYIWNSYTTILQLLGAKPALVREMAFSLYTRGFRGWHDFWDMGTNDKYTLEEDFKLMTERGEYQVAGALRSLRTYQLPLAPLTLAGRQMGACYLFGWHAMGDPRPSWGKSMREPYAGFSSGPTSWGELCFGAGLGRGLAETFLELN